MRTAKATQAKKKSAEILNPRPTALRMPTSSKTRQIVHPGKGNGARVKAETPPVDQRTSASKQPIPTRFLAGYSPSLEVSSKMGDLKSCRQARPSLRHWLIRLCAATWAPCEL